MSGEMNAGDRAMVEALASAGFDQHMMYETDSSQRCMKQDILVADLKSALLSRLAALRAERDALAKRVEEMEAGRDAARARVIREVVEKLANREVPGVIVSVRITNDAGLTGGWDDPESVRVVLLGALVEMIP